MSATILNVSISECAKIYPVIANNGADLLKVSKLSNGEDIEEGFFGAIAGGTVGALVGPAIGKAVCKVLGVDENGPLGKLLTSRLVSIAIGASLGK